ncbi:MAG: hypothetical protein CFE34_11960 [Rhodobacteraceae bacterium PARR1]|nr:MAG: hypothetical protein CFE34_11960 [Rhodobacteraceae bacterium PARR1]
MHRQGRYADTEVLCRQVLAIAAATIGTANGIYCMRIYQLANVIRTNLRFSEAVELYRQALDISGQRNRNIQEGNRLSGHGYWFNYDMLNYDAQIARALLTLLQTHFPDDPEIPALQALLAPTP